jgi:uroporphyrinogen-III synthase
MRPVIVIRPQPGCDASVADARSQGLDAHGFPLFEVHSLPWELPDPAQVYALLLGSANAVRHGGAALSALSGKPAYAVGEKTAQAARDAGFDVVETGTSGLQELLTQIRPDHRRLLRVAGQQRVEVTPPDGVTIEERTVYASEGLTLPDELAAMLARPAVVLIHSAESASHFASCCDAAGIDRSRIALAIISDRAATMAGEGWATVEVAQHPNDGALLALAGQMCQEPGDKNEKIAGSMQDQTTIEAFTPAEERGRSARRQLIAPLLAFALGAALVAWLGWGGYLSSLLPKTQETPPETVLDESTAQTVSPAATQVTEATAEEQLKAVGTVEGRLAMLEDRLSRLNLQANAASGNAARAEGLLIAFATRRMVDRGEPLRYLSDQLRLRFANAQPRAVTKIIEFSENPVTIDELTARLEALGPRLTRDSTEQSLWSTITGELSEMFVLRRDSSKVMSPETRIERARVMLTARRIPEAIEQVELLPGAEAADKWIVDAQRFTEVQSALDLIETAAMLEPTKLKDSEGKRIDQPSPIATPVEAQPIDMKKK